MVRHWFLASPLLAAQRPVQLASSSTIRDLARVHTADNDFWWLAKADPETKEMCAEINGPMLETLAEFSHFRGKVEE